MNRSLYAGVLLMGSISVLQASLFPRFPLWGMVPQFAVLAVIAWCLLRGIYEGLVWAFIAGLFLDLFSFSPLGSSVLALMPAVLIVGRLKQVLPENRFLLPPLLCTLGLLIYLLFHLAILSVVGLGRPLNTFNAIFPLLLLNALFSVPVYWLLHTLDRAMYPAPIEN